MADPGELRRRLRRANESCVELINALTLNQTTPEEEAALALVGGIFNQIRSAEAGARELERSWPEGDPA